MRLAGKIALCLLGLALLTAAGPAWAQNQGPTDVESIRKQLEELKIKYTDDHPEVIRLKEYLRKAMEKEERKKIIERAKKHAQTPETNRQFQEQESFE